MGTRSWRCQDPRRPEGLPVRRADCRLMGWRDLRTSWIPTSRRIRISPVPAGELSSSASGRTCAKTRPPTSCSPSTRCGARWGRWSKLDQAVLRAEDLPPVSLYKIGDAYFVKDGNHRVSVARQQGIEMIDAEVVELRSRVPVDSALTARDLLHKLEHRHLLERLPFDSVLPEMKVELSDVADYRRLANHVEAHGFRLSQHRGQYVSPGEALRNWHEHSYAPIAAMIREERVLDAFPDRSELDLYLWIVEHRERLALEGRDESVTPSAAKDDIVRRKGRKSGGSGFVNIYG